MKKITFLMMLLTVTFGFSQQEVVEDFESSPSVAGFEGLASATIVPDPSTAGNGQVFELVTLATGNPWQGAEVILADDSSLDLTSDVTVSVDVWSTVAFSPMLKVETTGSATAAPAAANTQSHTGSGWETLTYTLNTGDDGTATANGIYNKVVFFPNRSSNGAAWNTPVDGTFYFDNIFGVKGNVDTTPTGNPPTTTAPTPPARPAEDVFSVYSNAYTDEPSSLEAFGGGSLQDFNIDGDDFVRLSGAPGANLQWFFGIPDGVDLSSFTHYHMDFYFEGDVPGEGAIWQTIIQGFDAGSNFTGNTLHNVIPTETGVWLSLDIPIASFNGGTNVRNNIGQMQLAMAGPAFGPTYVDNVYFHKNTVLSTNEFNLESVSVSPNPTRNNWNVKTNNGQNITAVEVYDILGKQVLRAVPNASEYAINASELNDGIYLAKIVSNNGSTTIKLVKN